MSFIDIVKVDLPTILCIFIAWLFHWLKLRDIEKKIH